MKSPIQPGRRTSREQHILLRVIVGLRTYEIAEGLGTHTETVNRNILRIRDRLGCPSPEDTLVAAIRFGLIVPGASVEDVRKYIGYNTA